MVTNIKYGKKRDIRVILEIGFKSLQDKIRNMVFFSKLKVGKT